MGLFRRSVRDPQWGVEIGDVMALNLPSGTTALLQIVNSQPPNREYDYRRLTACVTDPENCDLSAGEAGRDSVVPVGAPAEPISFSFDSRAEDMAAIFAATIGAMGGQLTGPATTPGLVVIVPDDEGGSEGDPTRAGFRRVTQGAPPIKADGFAVLLRWDTLAERLRR
jgi:hypothetical protein